MNDARKSIDVKFIDNTFSCSADEFGLTIMDNPKNNERPLGKRKIYMSK